MKLKTIDESAVLTLIEIGKKSGSNLLGNLVVLFAEECPAALAGIKSFLDGGHLERIPQIAHLMKSSCANLGALALRDLFAAIEKSKANPDPVEIRRLVEEAELQYELALQELKELSKS